MPVPAAFREIPTRTVDEVRAILRERAPETFQLLDVRQPEEYAESHLPGALLIPVGELRERLGELARDRPTIVYCRSGMRAGNGTSVLLNAGFREVWNMAGGILAWKGIVATGAPEAGMAWFEAATTPEAYVALAWVLEAGAGIFYGRMAVQFASSDAGGLFRGLAAAEESHKASLRDVHRMITGKDEDPLPPAEVEARDTMEGGLSVSRVLGWAGDRPALDVLELAVAMEANAYDRYLKVAQAVEDPASRDILLGIAREEKAHLDRLVEAYLGQQPSGGFLA